RQFFYSLKKLGNPIALVINKVDNKKDEERAWEFANFGVKEIFNLSVTHNVGLDELYEWLEKFLHEEFLIPDEEENLEDFLEYYEEGKEFQFKEVDQNHIRVGIVGRANVGKSSLFNRMARQRIAITSDISGTTRDTNKTQIHIHSKKAMLIDSGGLDESDELFKNVKKNTLKVAKESDIILYLDDGKLAPDDEDRQFFYS
ncbi:GTP-binding protein, partial [Campylobacter upsaliensis]|nr:GTP-binding protein [Campylobacter upsaliensis]